MEKPLVSVLMCVYDTPKEYLYDSIDSIINQTYDNIEFIIVDDGIRNNEIKKILENYGKQDHRIKLIINAENIGLTKSLNLGLERANGKYIARMDGDDISLLTRVEKQVKYLEKNNDVMILGTEVIKFGEGYLGESRYFIDFTRGNYESFLISMMFSNVGCIHPSVMIRHSFLLENGIKYDESYRTSQDYKLWVDCILHDGKIYNLPCYLLKYRLHTGQMTARRQDEQSSNIKKIAKSLINGYGMSLKESNYRLISDMFSPVFLESPKNYIIALKELIEVNSKEKKFNKKLLKRNIYARWLYKVIKCTFKGGNVSAWFCLFTWKSVFSVALFDCIAFYMRRYKKYELG